MPLLHDLRQRRDERRATIDQILTRAAQEERDLTADEARDHQAAVTELRDLDDRVEELLSDQVAELRAARARHETPIENRGGLLLGNEIRALTTIDTNGGTAFSPGEYASYFLDRLAAQSVLLRSGVRTIRTTRDTLTVPKWISDTTAAFYAENTAISSSDADADPLTATPRKIAALQALSNEVIADSNPGILDVVQAGLVRSVALKFDWAAFEGTGTAATPDEILGLSGVTGITTDASLGDNGAVPTNLDVIAGAIGTLLENNANPGAIVMHPSVWSVLLKLKEVTSSSNKPLLNDATASTPRQIYGAPVFLSSQLSTTENKGTSTGVCRSIYVYDPAQILAVVREDVRVELDRSRLFNYDSSELRAVMRADVVVPNPAAVVRIEGVKVA